MLMGCVQVGWGGGVGVDGERLLTKLFLENIGRRSCNDGSLELIPVFHKPHRPSPSAVTGTLEYLVGVPS